MKHAQIQMFETIAVLLIFFFLIAFGLSFYFLVAKTQAAKEYERVLEKRAITLSDKIATIPELDCTKITVQVETCFDEYKVANFSYLLRKNATIKDDYFSTFGYSNVSIEEIFPEKKITILYEKKPLQTNSIMPSFIPINIRDPLTDKYKFAILKVNIYA
ncbi:MAG: hypothetical protein AABX52_03560 [Nanoarchaeota archaeon]